MSDKICCLYCLRKATHWYLSDDGVTEYYLCTPCSEAFNAGTSYASDTTAIPIGCTPEGEEWIEETTSLVDYWLGGGETAKGMSLSYYAGIGEELAVKIMRKFGASAKLNSDKNRQLEKMLRKDYYKNGGSNEGQD